MKEVDFKASRARCDDRCINISKLARKYDVNKNTMTRYLNGKLEGKPDVGEYGKIQNALLRENLLVIVEK